MIAKNYSDLILLPTFEERFAYLQLDGRIAHETLGSRRYLVERFYHSEEWRRLRRYLIMRDNGCDLGCPERPIFGDVIIHHIQPIDTMSITYDSAIIRDPNNLVCCSRNTHQAIHYGNVDRLTKDYEPRSRNDTCPWKAVTYE